MMVKCKPLQVEFYRRSSASTSLDADDEIVGINQCYLRIWGRKTRELRLRIRRLRRLSRAGEEP